MQFFERARRSKFKTKGLVFFFILLYLTISLSVGAVIAGFAGFFYGDYQSLLFEFIVASSVTFLLMTMFTYSKYCQLKMGTAYILKALGALEVDELHTNPIIRRYYQVAAEMAIAANMSLPRTYILPTGEINALATASSDEDIAIAITEGALTKLNREELKGIIAHEMSHIYHRDCILNFNLVAWLAGLQSTYLYGRDLFQRLSGTYPQKLDQICLGYTNPFYRQKSITFLGFVPLIVATGIMIVGFGGAVLARAIKASITREREYLADAEAVRLTRSHELANVLKKIALLEPDEAMEEYRSQSIYQEISHFYLNDYSADYSALKGSEFNENAMKKAGWFDTHPPILMRIKAIDPKFRIPSLTELEYRGKMISYDNFNPITDDEEMAMIQYATNQERGTKRDTYYALGIDHTNRRLFKSLAVFYAVTLDSNHKGALFNAQQAYLKENVSEAMLKAVSHTFYQDVIHLDQYEKVSYFINNTPQLGRLHPDDFEHFRNNLKELILIDKELTIFEYSIWKYVEYIYRREGSYANKGMDFTQPKRPIIEMADEVATFFNIILLESIIDRKKAEEIYQSIVVDFAPERVFEEEVAWYKVLEEALPQLAETTIAGSDYMAEKLTMIFEHPLTTNNGKTLIHIFMLILNYPLPRSLRYQHLDPTERIISR